MNFLNNSKRSKYTLAISTLLVASSAMAAAVITLKPATAPDKFAPATPTDSFKLADDTAAVEKSQLEWSRCLVGQTFSNGACTGKPTEFATWEDALAAPSTQQAAEGWRVPNIKELVRITETTQAYPAINTEVFPFATSFEFSQADDYHGLPARPSSPYIWSSTPAFEATSDKHPTTFQPYTPEEYQAQLEKNRLNAERVYALDLSIGDTEEIYRSGVAMGDIVTTVKDREGKDKKVKPHEGYDPDSIRKARYVLLVKDVS